MDRCAVPPVGFLNSSFLLPPSSFLACARITHQANSSFPVAFRLLPRAKRRAMDALYAFMRVTDDLADEPGEPAAKRARLADWRAALDASRGGTFAHPVFPALAHTVRTFDIPPRYLHDVIDGVGADIEPVRFASFAELYPYCYRVASAVGLACVRVWGARDGVTPADALAPAEAAGIAFQLTNILRDLGEDVARGRVYLPADELAHFRCPPEEWRTPAFRELMRFQIDRARDYYRRGAALGRLLCPDGAAIFGVMSGTYRALLDEIEARGYDVFTHRCRVPKWRKGIALARGWSTKWGWA